MPGNPKQAELEAQVAALGGGNLEEGWSEIIDSVADGKRLKDWARLLGVSSSFLSWRINDDPERKARLARARKMLADHHLEKAEDAAEEPIFTPVDASRAKLRADVHLQLAKLRDPELQAPKTQVNVAMSFGDLHLDALRRRTVVSAHLAVPPDQRALTSDEELAKLL
jgi:hypothetical protein